MAIEEIGNGRPEVHQPQILAQCAILIEQSELLMKLAQELEERLNAILRPADNEKNANVPDEVRKAPEPLAPHANFLGTQNNLLKRISGHLGNVISRIEL